MDGAFTLLIKSEILFLSRTHMRTRSLALFLVVLLAVGIAATFALVYEQKTLTVSQTIVRYWSSQYNYRRRITVTNNIVGWLSGWDKRVRLTIDQGDIDSVLTDFPVLLYLSSSSGRNNANISCVFDELQNYNNRRKLAVTTDDGITECYVEIEKWDTANKQAWLWVRVPTINDTANTIMYLYYDADHADNTAHVSDVGSTPARNVWDGSFAAVWHLGESAGGTDAIKDSTFNSNDGTDNGGVTFGVMGQIGSATRFDGVDDCVIVPDNVTLRLGSGLTIEAWINIGVWGNWKDIVFKGGGAGGDSDYQFALVSTGLAWDGTYGGTWRTKYFPTSQDTSIWIYVAVTHDTVTVKCYRNGSEISSQSDAGAIYESTYQLGISREGAANTGYLNGVLDEIRISNTTRSAAWIKACYESERDDLFDYGSEENSLVSEYSVSVVLNTTSLVSAGKMLSNGNDLRIVYWNGSSWTELDRQIIDMNTTSTQVWFKTQADISAGSSDNNYFMYYGNSAPPAPLDYWSDSMGADSPSRVYWYADSFEEHANNTDPDGWTNEGSEDYNVVVYEGNRWLKRMVRVNWENGTFASSMSNVGDAVWMVDIHYNQTGSNVWGGIAFHYDNGGVGYHFLIRDQGWYWANEDWTVTDGWNTNTNIHFTLGQTGTIKIITIGTTAYCYWINPEGESPHEVLVVTKTIPPDTGKVKVVVESPSVGNNRWIDADNVIVRKYIDPEPSTSLGPEENL
jgi:hypothetical protein